MVLHVDGAGLGGLPYMFYFSFAIVAYTCHV